MKLSSRPAKMAGLLDSTGVEIWGAGGELPSTCSYCPPGSSATWPPDSEETAGSRLPVEDGSGSVPVRDLLARGKIGRFQVREILGNGVFGQVFRAYDPRLERDLALKVLKQAHPDERTVERFFREACAAARLDHPNIVPLHDAGRSGGRFWIAYPFIAGPTLHAYRERYGVDDEAAARIVRALADAMAHAHAHGVFHRDLKPTNVLIDPAGRPRLIDFGLARCLDYDSTLTHEGAILGTPAYMSPEQAAGRSRLADARSDIYSLGVILYELLGGARPGIPPAPLRALRRDVTAALDRICRQALAQDPIDRHPDARALADDLDRWLRARRRGRGPVRWLSRVAAGLFALTALS